jgi:hypothetical protein
MLSTYSREIESYKIEINQLEPRLKDLVSGNSRENLTHASLGFSNRTNLLLVGMCGLVEAKLFELGKHQTSAKINQGGLIRIKEYLSSMGIIDFGKLRYWSKFLDVYQVRNQIVHSYGGLVESSNLGDIRKSLGRLNYKGALVGNRRIRLRASHLNSALDIVEGLLNEL